MNALALAQSLVHATEDQVREVFRGFGDAQALSLLWDWKFWARPEQLLPEDEEWDTWLILSGRGWGKTRVGAQTVLGWMQDFPGCRIALVGATVGDANGTMLEGESGLLNVAPPWFPLHHEPSKRRVKAPNGSKAYTFSAEEPDRLRGPQFHFAWCDELAAWPEPYTASDDTAWKMLGFGLRLGKKPRAIVTTTPKPTKTVIDLATRTDRVHVTYGHTFDNAANLAASYVRQMKSLYAGTRLGAQELAGKLLMDAPGALFKGSLFAECAVAEAPALDKTIIAIDPAATSNEGNDFTGIMAMSRGADGHVYLHKDLTLKGSPDAWARAGVKAFYQYQANYIIGEINVGGEMVETTIKTVDDNVPFKAVRAMKGKAKRAEPVAAALEQRKIHIVGNPESDDWAGFIQQASRFTGVNGKRDDRVDAMCWGVHDLLFGESSFFLL